MAAGEGESVFFQVVAAGRFHLVNDPPHMLTQAAQIVLNLFLLSEYGVWRWVCIKHLVEVRGRQGEI